MRPNLIAFDLDETVLFRGADITDETIDALENAHAQGCLLAVATGRHPTRIPACVLRLPLAYIISSNGAQILDVRTGTLLYRSTLERDLVLRIMDDMEKRRGAFNVQFSDGMYFELRMRWRIFRSMPWCKRLANLRRMARNVHHVVSVRRAVARRSESIVKFSVLLQDRDEAYAACRRICADYPVEAVLNGDREIEITKAGTTKGEALAVLARHIGMERAHIAAFGDSGNDLSMRASAGILVAMGNACEEMKKAADFTTLRVEQNGVAAGIERLMQADGKEIKQ